MPMLFWCLLVTLLFIARPILKKDSVAIQRIKLKGRARRIEPSDFSDYLRSRYQVSPLSVKVPHEEWEDSTLYMLLDYHQIAYCGSLLIGTPPQEMALLFDLNTADFWIATTNCTSNLCKSLSRLLDTTTTSSLVHAKKTDDKNITISYSKDDWVKGVGSADVVELIGEGGWEEKRTMQPFIAANALSETLVDAPYSGVIGLAFPEAAVWDTTSIIQTWRRQGMIASASFSLWLSNDGPFGGERAIGEIALGLPDQARFHPPLIEANLYRDNSLWNVRGTQMLYGSKKISDKPGQIIFDMHSFAIVVPKAVGEGIANVTGAFILPQEDFQAYTLPCDMRETLQPISIDFAGHSFVLEPDVYFKPAIDPAAFCSILLIGQDIFSDGDPVWILGLPFLRTYYSVFNFETKQMQFARAVHPLKSSTLQAASSPHPS